jgi:hypothetical protein
MAKRAMVHPGRNGDDEVIVTGSINIAASPLVRTARGRCDHGSRSARRGLNPWTLWRSSGCAIRHAIFGAWSGDRQLVLREIVVNIDPVRSLGRTDEAITRLSSVDDRAADRVKLRLFAGLSLDEAASALGVVRRTAERDCAFARARLFQQLTPPERT